MTSFANLMAISATNTRKSQLAVETALQERQRKEALQRKQREEREAKELEQEKKLRLRRLEEEKRQQERERRLEEERQAKALALQRKEEAQREALRHGPKKAAKLAASGSAGGSSGSAGGDHPKWPKSSSAAAKTRLLDDSDGESPGLGLTREELRKKKQEAELRRMYKTSKKSTQSSRRSGKNKLHLPGGALNVVKPEEEEEDPNPPQGSVRDRLLNKPNTLTRLNLVKKDQRTIFEQLEDARASKKVLDGHEALQFDSWFSNSKKKEADKKRSPVPISPATPSSRLDSPVPREYILDDWKHRLSLHRTSRFQVFSSPFCFQLCYHLKLTEEFCPSAPQKYIN
jgi:protein SPT2